MTFKALKAANETAKQSNFFIKVSRDVDKGYWEIDYVNQTANFRFLNNQQLPKSIQIVDHTDDIETIQQFLGQTLFMYTKEIIKDKKYLFSDKFFCDVSDCDQPAMFKRTGNQKRCSSHMNS